MATMAEPTTAKSQSQFTRYDDDNEDDVTASKDDFTCSTGALTIRASNKVS